MAVAINSVVAVFKDEEDKQCEFNAKASFLLHQVLNYTKEARCVRYDQWTIKYCIAIQGRSPTIYDFLRQQNLLTLPALNTLYSYTGRTNGSVGITSVNLERLKVLFKTLSKSYERSISLEVDEMACKSLLLWIQSRQQFVGEVDFGGVGVFAPKMDDEGLDISYGCEDAVIDEDVENVVDADGGKISKNAAFMKNESSNTSNGPPVLANSLINFVMTGLTTKFTSIVGTWPVARLTGRQLFFLTIHVIRTLEDIGFTVERVVGDNAKINVALFKLLRKQEDEEPFLVTQPIDSARKLFVNNSCAPKSKR
ncbi:uncharacterized protein LOC123473779 [Daphnia magna]|nr:uncharacterized protein LOC123473779 [Daphnia magna]